MPVGLFSVAVLFVVLTVLGNPAVGSSISTANQDSKVPLAGQLEDGEGSDDSRAPEAALGDQPRSLIEYWPFALLALAIVMGIVYYLRSLSPPNRTYRRRALAKKPDPDSPEVKGRFKKAERFKKTKSEDASENSQLDSPSTKMRNLTSETEESSSNVAASVPYPTDLLPTESSMAKKNVSDENDEFDFDLEDSSSLIESADDPQEVVFDGVDDGDLELSLSASSGSSHVEAMSELEDDDLDFGFDDDDDDLRLGDSDSVVPEIELGNSSKLESSSTAKEVVAATVAKFSGPIDDKANPAELDFDLEDDSEEGAPIVRPNLDLDDMPGDENLVGDSASGEIDLLDLDLDETPVSTVSHKESVDIADAAEFESLRETQEPKAPKQRSFFSKIFGFLGRTPKNDQAALAMTSDADDSNIASVSSLAALVSSEPDTLEITSHENESLEEDFGDGDLVAGAEATEDEFARMDIAAEEDDEFDLDFSDDSSPDLASELDSDLESELESELDSDLVATPDAELIVDELPAEASVDSGIDFQGIFDDDEEVSGLAEAIDDPVGSSDELAEEMVGSATFDEAPGLLAEALVEESDGVAHDDSVVQWVAPESRDVSAEVVTPPDPSDSMAIVGLEGSPIQTTSIAIDDDELLAEPLNVTSGPEVAELQSQLDSLLAEKSELSDKLSAAQTKLVEHEASIEELKTAAAEQLESQQQSQQQSLSAKEAEWENAKQAAVAEAKADVESLRSELESLRASFESEKRSLDSELESMKAELTLAKEQLEAAELKAEASSELMSGPGLAAVAGISDMTASSAMSDDEIADLKVRFEKKLKQEHRKRKDAQAFLEEAEAQRNQVAADLRAARQELLEAKKLAVGQEELKNLCDNQARELKELTDRIAELESKNKSMPAAKKMSSKKK